jgi:hypothetical protein
MSTRASNRVQKTQRLLVFAVMSGVMLWTGAALLGGLMLATAIGAVTALPSLLQSLLPSLALAGALVTLIVLAWRKRFVWYFDRVALWIEERAPELRYALVTAVDPRYRDTIGPSLDSAISRVDTGAFVRKAAAHTLAPAASAALAMSLLFVFLPSSWKERFHSAAHFGSGTPTAAVAGNRLLRLAGTLSPPGYSGYKTEALADPSTITGLQGSRVTLTGAGAPDGIQATLGEHTVPIEKGGHGWSASFTLADSLPAALELVDRKYRRLIVVDPRIDRAPTARLLLPVRDTTLRVVSGMLSLSATFSDDVGLATTQFEYIVAQTGAGDDVTARTGTLGAHVLSGKDGAFAMSVPYASLKLTEGDLLSVRAVVLDNNTLYGPGKGYSETRTIRVARKEEYDSLSVNAAPPSADTAMISLRMLIIATQKLERERPNLQRIPFVDSAQKLAGTAETVRQKIQGIIDEQTGGGEIAPNPLLLQAAEAMLTGKMSLLVAETGEAIPQLWIAYRALEKLRNEKKYYVRGRLPPVIVNIERVRLTGTDTGKALPRGMVRPDAETEKARVRAQYADAIRELRFNPTRAVELFTLLRVSTLRTNSPLAMALGEATTALQGGVDATLPLLRARRVIDGSKSALEMLPKWSGAW